MMVQRFTDMQNNIRRVCALFMSGLLIMTQGACSAGGQAASESSSGTSEAAAQPMQLAGLGQKNANSLSEYIDWYESRLYEPPSQFAQDVLDRAKETGNIPMSDYEAAWSRYKQCMTGRGIKEIVLIKYPNGLYVDSLHREGTQAQEQKASEDQSACYGEVVPVIDVYGVQVGNVNFYANASEAIVDCLHRSDLVPGNYTAGQYAAEKASGNYSFDDRNMEVRGCEVAKNSVRSFADEPVATWF